MKKARSDEAGMSAKAYNDRGLDRAEAGDLAAAMKDFNRAIDLDPKLVPAWFNRGLARCMKGDNQRAIADLNEAIRLAPDYADAWGMR